MRTSFVLGIVFSLVVVSLHAEVPVGKRPVDKVKQKGSENDVPKIVGGEKVKAGEFPFQVALIRSDSPVGN